MSNKILFTERQGDFSPASKPTEQEWFDTSFSKSPRATGALRFPAVDNGRYENKHPILDPAGRTVGHMVDGRTMIGYTFACVYAGSCFWIAHMTFGATMSGGSVSEVSLVDATGNFLFSSARKFEVVKSFSLEGLWVHGMLAFKLLDDGATLLFLTDHGVCLFDTRRRELTTKVEFDRLQFQVSGFALSPKVKLLAVGCTGQGSKDLLDGEYRYRNFVRIYDLETGGAVGEQTLPEDERRDWTVDFSEDGRSLRATSRGAVHAFDLAVGT